MSREPILMAVCGKKGVGKSFKTMEYIRKYVKGDAANGVPGRKALIFDVNNEYADKTKFPDIYAIRLDDIIEYSRQRTPQIRRVAPFFNDGTAMTLDDMSRVLQFLVTTFKNGLFLIEDINKYVSDTMPGDLIGAICTNRHSGVDIILHYQSIGRFSPKIWQNINVIRMHKITDPVERHKNKFPDKEECMKIAERIVKDQYLSGNIRFYLFVDFDDEKIYAPGITEEQKRAAIKLFIAENYNRVMSTMFNVLDESGKKYTAEAALAIKEKELYEQYFS